MGYRRFAGAVLAGIALLLGLHGVVGGGQSAPSDVAPESDDRGYSLRELAGWDSGEFDHQLFKSKAGNKELLKSASQDGSITVGTWNWEWFHSSAKRGFPELPASRKFPPRTDADLKVLASEIEKLGLSLVLLQEIQGVDIEGDYGENGAYGPVMDRLLKQFASPTWDYAMGSSGGSQRLAMLYRRDTLHMNSFVELDDKDEVFERTPIFAHFTIIDADSTYNDFTAVDVHLKSGQHKTAIHDLQMGTLRAAIDVFREKGQGMPKGENDIIIGGDLNANRFDKKQEAFWDIYETAGLDILADDDSTYSATRMSGKDDYGLHESKIDYLIVSSWKGGLLGNEVAQTTGQVHTELLERYSPLRYRERLSDHLAVTVTIKVVQDDD